MLANTCQQKYILCWNTTGMLEFVVREGRIVIYYTQISVLLHSRGHVFQFLAVCSD